MFPFKILEIGKCSDFHNVFSLILVIWVWCQMTENRIHLECPLWRSIRHQCCLHRQQSTSLVQGLTSEQRMWFPARLYRRGNPASHILCYGFCTCLLSVGSQRKRLHLLLYQIFGTDNRNWKDYNCCFPSLWKIFSHLVTVKVIKSITLFNLIVVE